MEIKEILKVVVGCLTDDIGARAQEAGACKSIIWDLIHPDDDEYPIEKCTQCKIKEGCTFYQSGKNLFFPIQPETDGEYHVYLYTLSSVVR